MFPSFTPLPADHFSRSNRTLFQLTLVLILSAFILSALGAGSTRAADTQPTVSAKVFDASANLISIQGDGFTPGGRVQVFITDLTGTTLHEPVWTVAAPGAPFGDYGNYSGVSGYGDPGTINLVLNLGDQATYGPNGSQDPARGYDAGTDLGTLQFASSTQVRAFDEYASTWTSFAVVTTEPDSTLELRRGYPIRYDVPQRCMSFILCSLPL